MPSVKLIAITEIKNEELKNTLKATSPEELMMYCARVSNPKNQKSGNTGLLNYCMREGHFSIFEMANMVVEIETSRAISAQILRHRSFSFQEFSQRYAAVQSCETYQARSQDLKNRQNSIDDMHQQDKDWFLSEQKHLQHLCNEAYKEALDRGIAKEQARFLLPMASSTKLYMNGTIRSWIHYLNLRCGNGTQLEHKEIADAIKTIFCEQLPVVAKALDWK